MNKKITEIVKGMRSLACAIVALVATSAALPLMADGLAITPTEIPAATQQVYYAQTFTASGASGGLSWSTVAWKVESAASTYAVGASETPLWDGAKTFYTNIVYTLPFAFPYRDQSFTNLYIRADGILFFTRGRNEYYSSVGNFDYLYNVLVPFWMEEAENVEGYVDTSVANEVSFRFEASYTNSSEVACKFAYCVTLKSDGTIRYSYRQDAGDTIGDSRRAVGLSYYDAVNYNHFSLPVGEESDGIPTCDYVFTTYTGYPNGFTFQGNYDYSSELYYPTATLSGQTSEFGTWTLGVSVYDAGTSTATTNSYTLTVAENPDKPPVFDAFTPADTNTVRALAIGDSLNFHVEASDPKGGPFDITWTFLDADVESPVKRTLGTGADLTFVASNELYEIQRWGGSSAVKCTISDTYWTNSITWRVYISKEFYLDPAADPGAADGSAAHPWATIPEPAFTLRKGDTLNLVPGVYVIDDDSLGFPGGVTIRTTGSSADTKIVYPDGDGFFQGQNDHLKIANITVEGIRFQNADLEDCTIIGVQSPSYCFDDCSFTRCYVTGNSTTKEYLFRDSTLEDCTVAGNTIGYSASDDYFTGYTAIGPYCQLVRSIVVNNLTLDGDEANWVDQEYWGIAATNCCTIPAMTDYGPGNFEAQPTFVSLEGYDARLRVGSACIDANNTANNVGAYKGPGVEGFAVLATTDPVRGTVAFSGDVDFKSAHATHIVASGGSVTVTATAVTNRVFKNWIVNGEEGATTPTLTLDDITADTEVEAVFEVKEFYVNPTEADDSGNGSAAAPKKTIAAAAALALDGETIRLAEGSYEPFALTSSSKITLLGAGPDKTFIDGGGTNWCVRLGSNATLKNVAVVNGKYTSWSSYAGGVTGGTIENCVVSNCVSSQSAGGIYNATVVSSLIVNNVNTNTSYNYAGYPAGVGNCEVYNSTIANNISSGYPGGVSDSYLKNCIVYGNTAKVGWTEYNEVSSCDGDGDIYDTNLIGSDPWFVNAANGDYRLIAGSPAIDAGEDVPEFDFAHMTDLAGDRRIRGTAVDYGCYEGGIVTGAPAAPVATGTSAKAGKGLPFVWAAVPNAAEYRIYRGTSDNAASATQVGTTTATNYLDLATTGGTDYFYWISAWNSQYGESEKCGPIAVTSYADLKIETASLPAATEAVPYSVQLECSGNVGAATWSLPYTVYTREANTFDGSVGTAMETPFSSEYYGCCYVEFPFTFNWFGAGYTAVTVSTRGGIYFGKTTEWLSWGSTSLSSDMPKIAVLEGVSGSGDYSTITGVSVATNGDNSVTIVCTGTYGGYSSHPAEFSVTFYPDNSVRLAYGEDCIYGGYVAWSNGSDDTKTSVYRTRDISFAGMDDIVITSLLNESHLALSEDGLLSGVEDYAGTYRVTALVTDTDNGDVAYKTYTLTVNANANARPVIDATSPATGGSQFPATITKVVVPEGDSQTFAIAAHDPEGTALSYKWYLDDALVASGTNYTFTATELSRHTLTCEVSDALWTNGQVYAEWEIAVGKKFYVDAVNGTTNGTGTAGSPFKTIMAALDEAISYEASTILVAPGTYGQSYLSGGWYSGGPTIVVRSTGSAADTFIDGNGRSPCVANYCFHDGFTFEGFTLRNGYADDYWTPSRGGGGSFMVNLKNCVVYNCTAESAGGGVFGATIDHCTIYGCSAGTGGGIDATSTAINSIVWGNTATNAGATATANYETGAQFENCCTTPLPEGANIAEDPQFVNAAGGDFRLADTSPCIAPGMGCFTTGGGAPVGTTYTVTFNANGGTCAEATRTVAKGKAVGTLPQATRAGYTLKGWYTAKSGGSPFSATTTITKDITLYAQWTAIPTYTVTFDVNGGTCATKTRQVYQGAVIGELPEATRDGWALAGWFTAKTGGSQFTATDTITKNITLYARWTEVYELVIDENGVLTGLTGTTPAALDVPATVTAFAADLFKGVTKITSATGGANVTKCGAGAFRDSGIWKAAPNGPVVVCGVLVGYKGTVPATLDVPNGVRVIADGALAGATTLATVYLPESLVAIGDGAFKNCTKLDDVIGLEPGVTVAADAFEGTLHGTFRLTWSGTVVTGFKGPCSAEIVIPANATGIGVGAFSNQTAITSITYEGTNAVIVGSSAFEGCANLATVNIGGLTTIGANAFLNCTSLTNAEFGGIPSIGARAFEGCALLAAIELPETLTDIGAAAFKDCATLAEIHLPASLVTMGEYAFAGCAGITNVTGGAGLLEIRKSAFDGTAWYDAPMEGDGFTEVVLGHVLLKIRGVLPASYEISTNVTMVSSEAFMGQTTLSDLYIGTEVAGILDRAFAGCTSLGSVTVPSGCRDFGDYLFEGCTSLTNVYFRGHAPTNDIPHVFAGTPETLKVHIKAGSRGWEYPGADSDFRPDRWPYQTKNDVGWARWKRISDDLNRAVYEAEPQEGVLRSVLVDGVITNDTTWTAGKVYEIQYHVLVATNVTLTIEAGTIIKMPRQHTDYWFGWVAGSSGMTVEGHLQINGTKANPVVFTSAADDTWGGDTNGDGNRSEPQPGDSGGINVNSPWGVYVDGVHIQSTVDATHAKFMYGEMESVELAVGFCVGVNSPKGQPCRSVFRNCEFSHATQVGVVCTGALFENCIFTDCDRGIMTLRSSGPTRVVNSVAYGNRVGFSIDYEDLYITNSIVAFNTDAGLGHENGLYSGAVYATRCCLWNPGGVNTTFPNQGRYIYNVENIEADPLFIDPENGDFQISVESPCVDAAFGAVAPEYDFWGQPRMDVKYVRNTGRPNAAGEYPDIGLYEVPGTTERPVMNLEVESVSFAPASAAPGETLTVTYTVRNTGNTAAKGSIRDVVRIKSAANGGTMVAGTVTQLYNLEPGASVELTASVAVPSAPAGEWLVGIDVNPNRDVFEQNFLKNSLWTEDAVEVTLPEMTMGMTGNAAVSAATTVGYMLKDVPEEGGIVVITAAGTAALPVIARVATGHMPTAVMNDATSFVRADGSIALVIPAHAAGDTVYLSIENTGIESITLNSQLTTLNLELWSVYPEIAANVGDMGFTFTGSGLNADSEFYLGGIKAKSVSVIDSANVYAVFDVQNIAADRYYDVSADGKTIRDAVYINKKAKGPILEAKLELPERTRDNRVYTGYVVYENTGDTQMNAPTFIINIAEASSTNTVIGAYDDDDDNLTLQRVLIVGLGSSHPAGVLKPGDSGRLPFKFKPVGSYRFKLDSRYTSDEVAGAVTRMNLRGGSVRFDGSSARGLANLIKKGEEAAAVSGWLLDSRTREPLADAGLGLTLVADATGGSPSSATEPFVRTATTDANGYFSFEQLRDGAYQLSADVGYVLVTTNLITVAGQADVNGYEAMALPPGVVTGYAMSDDGNPIQYGDVTLFAAGDMVGTTVKTDGYGAYRFTGLEDGAYTVYAKPFESFRGVMVTNVVIEAAGRERRIDMELKRTARAYGTVTMYNGGTAVDGEVRLYDDEGNFLKADVATNGVWEAAGIPVGEYSFAYVSADGALDSARVVAAFAQGDEREIALEARPAIMFRASTRFGAINVDAGETLEVRFAATGYANNTNVVAVQWDFGDGEPIEVDEVETTHTYATTGYKTVRLRPKYADGTYGDWDETENYIFVSAPVETIYKANAIVLQGFDDAGAVTNVGTLVVTGVGTNWLELAGTGGIPLEAGVVIAGSYTNAENEADWFVRKVVAVSGDAGGWRLATEYGDEDDLYEQYWSNWGFGAAEEEGGSGGASLHGASLLSARGPARLMAGDKKKGFGDRAKSLLPKIYGEGGVTFNVMCSPDITCFYSYYRLNIKGTNYVTRRFRDYHEMVPEVYGDMHRELRIFGDVSLTANIDISAEYSGGWKKEYQYDLLPKVMKAAPQAAKIIPHFTIKAEAAGKIGGSLHGEASVIGYIDVGFTKETGKKIQWHKPDPFKGHVDMSFETAGEKEAAGKLHASVGAGFGVTMKVFEVLSATADVTFSAKAEAVIPSKGPSKASINIGYDTEIAMNFIDFSWLNADWKVGLDWSIEGLSFWGMEWISPEPSFIYRQPHEKEWPARITVTDRSKTGTFVRNNGRTEVLPITSVSWDYGQGQTYSYDKSQIDNGTYKRHRIIEFNEEGEYTVSLNVQGGIMPNIFPCQKKIKIKKPEEDEIEEQTKIQKEEWFSEPQNTQQSYDPNALEGPEGVGEERFVKPGQKMNYTIYFENKSDAAIAAQEVFVDNPLSEYLDWSTFEMGTVSVGGQIDSKLDGYTAAQIVEAMNKGDPLASEMDQTNGLYKTRTEVQFDAATGVASWYIRVLDPVKRKAGDGESWPDDDTAGVLQPNLLPPDGEGYITYSVCVSSNAPAKAIIDNWAEIIFDQNPAIVTDPAWWNTVAGNDVGFTDAALEVNEGESVTVTVNGGNIDKASSVQLYLTYNTAAAADIDLKTGAVDGEIPKGGLKFPLTLSWAKGEIGAKTVTIPVKTDKTVEGDEFFTLQLAAPNGMTVGDASVCTVTIRDTNDKTLKPTVTPYKPKAGETVATNSVTVAAGNAKGGFVVGTGEYTAGSKLTLTAEARPGWTFVGWAARSASGPYQGEILSNKAKWQIVVTNDAEYVAVFEKIPYVRGLADPADGGKVSGSGLCAAGKKVTLKASANKNFTFLGWVCGGRGATALPDDGDGRAGSPLPAADGEYVATTPSLVIDRTAKPAKDSKTSTTITNIAEDVTYYAVFKSDPEIFVTVDATDGTGAEPTGKGAGKYVAGTITGMGKYAPGKTKIALKAAANKGYVFAGWLDANGELLTKDATYAIATMGESDMEYTAKFVTADEDKASIELAVAMGAEAEAFGLSTNEIVSVTNFCGVAMNWPVTSGGLSETKVKVSGLPSGLKFTDKPVTSKVGSGKTAVTVTNVPANTIYGAPTAASKTDKNGNVTPSKVLFTVTTAGKSTQTFAINLYIDPLPDWAVGTFDGATYAGDSVEASGLVQAFTVAVNGKISGKLLRDDGTWTLSADSFASYDATNDVYLATVIGKNGKLLETNEVKVAASGVTGTTLSEAAVTWTAYQNLWKRADTKAEQPVIKKDIKVDYELVPGDANNKLTLTFKKDGAVAFAGKVGGASVSGSSQLVNDGEGWKVTLYAPAKGTFAGFCRTLAVTLTLDAPNIVKDVTIGGGDAPAGSGSWFTGEFTGYGDAQFPAGGDTEFLNGIFTINVAANLAFTGTFTGTDGSTASFSGTFAKDGSSYVATGVSITVKGKTMSMGLMCDPQPYAGSDEGFGEIGGGSEDVQDEPCIALNCAWQNIWKRTDLAAEWKPAFAAGTEKTLDLKDTWLADLSVGDSLTYAFGADGAVSITGKIYGESVNATATLDLEGLDGSNGTMHCNFFFLANGHLYQQQFTFPRQATVTATDITLDSFVRID